MDNKRDMTEHLKWAEDFIPGELYKIVKPHWMYQGDPSDYPTPDVEEVIKPSQGYVLMYLKDEYVYVGSNIKCISYFLHGDTVWYAYEAVLDRFERVSKNGDAA